MQNTVGNVVGGVANGVAAVGGFVGENPDVVMNVATTTVLIGVVFALSGPLGALLAGSVLLASSALSNSDDTGKGL